MRISDYTRYPYAVLSPFNDDYIEGSFTTSFAVSENLSTGALTLRYDVSIEEPMINELVLSNKAIIGCIIVSLETYYIKLHKLDHNSGLLDFSAGTLLGEVNLRPVIWLDDESITLNSENINSEFNHRAELQKGSIIAVDEETTISVGNAKLAPLESIFELVMSADIPEGRVHVKLDSDRIGIMFGKKTFAAIDSLRGQEDHLPIVTSSIYLPALMEVLDLIRINPEAYSDRRWYKPFSSKCTFKGVSLAPGGSSLEGAQTLLNNPLFEIFENDQSVDHE